MKRTPDLQTGDILILGSAIGRVKEPNVHRLAPAVIGSGWTARHKSVRALSRAPSTWLTCMGAGLIMLFSTITPAPAQRRGRRRGPNMWDSPLYVEYAARERMRELTSEAQRVSLETTLQTPRPRGLWRRLARGLISLGLHVDPQVSGPASPTRRPRLAPREPKTDGARAGARLGARQWRKEVMRLLLAIGMARYLS